MGSDSKDASCGDVQISRVIIQRIIILASNDNLLKYTFPPLDMQGSRKNDNHEGTLARWDRSLWGNSHKNLILAPFRHPHSV